MAVIPTLPGIETTIQVNGRPLIEYNDDDMNGEEVAHGGAKTISKYIEAVTGQEFTVFTSVRSPYQPDAPSLLSEIWADGRWVSGEVYKTPGYMMHNPMMHSTVTRTSVGATDYDSVRNTSILHHFKFVGINTTSDEKKLSNIKKDIARMSKVGTIEVKFFRGSEPFTIPRYNGVSLEENSAAEVHEKALKGQAKSHGISSGRTSAGNPSVAKVDYLDGRDSPIATFRFHYRSLEALKQLCIVRRTPELEPDPVGRPGPRNRLAPPRNVKRERQDENNVKWESGQPKTKRSKYKVTIDLTADSDSDANSIVSLH